MLLQKPGTAGQSGRFVRETWKPVGTWWTGISTTLVQVSWTLHSDRVSAWEPQQAVVLWWAGMGPGPHTPDGLLWYCMVLVLSWFKVYIWDLWSTFRPAHYCWTMFAIFCWFLEWNNDESSNRTVRTARGEGRVWKHTSLHYSKVSTCHLLCRWQEGLRDVTHGACWRFTQDALQKR